MPQSSIPLKPELSDTANLRQAVQWIIYGWEPYTEPYDKMLHGHGDAVVHSFMNNEEAAKITKAQQALFIALRQGHINATADLAEIELHSSYDEDSFHILSHRGVKAKQLIAQERWVFDNIDFADNYLTYSAHDPETSLAKHYAYIMIELPVSELYAVFPPQLNQEEDQVSFATPAPLAPISKGYTSPYIDLMMKAIKELGITNNHQPVKKVIEAWLQDNAPAEGLSGRDIQAMATFIRLPEKKRGGSGGDNLSRTAPKPKSKPATQKRN